MDEVHTAKEKLFPNRQTGTLPGRGRTGRKLSAQFLARRFLPGQSGNPNGNRGSTYGEVVRIAREYSEPAILRLVQLMHSDDERVSFMACNAVLERAFGKSKDQYAPDSERAEIEQHRKEVRDFLVAALDAKAHGKW